ncbi:MAG TPA: MoaD/ThiS family protein [Fervidicoccus fontis]|uniref:MoaD/ThiS family protein n=1 Tax=Fervidicoccus fontis TaxID=683846 RepID=A0A7C2UPM0_9CREN|nr:MAG: molybdopterin synthase sulfur carrier subunit [Fervidicoccus sp.]HEU97247.1 MoaD/ThiS family protein [Fervidicoccus fontis]
MIHVRVYAMLIDLVGSRTLEVEGARTVKELLDILDSRYHGFKKELEKGFLILVNGVNVLHLNGLDTEIKDGDTVVIFPPVGGG